MVEIKFSDGKSKKIKEEIKSALICFVITCVILLDRVQKSNYGMFFKLAIFLFVCLLGELVFLVIERNSSKKVNYIEFYNDKLTIYRNKLFKPHVLYLKDIKETKVDGKKIKIFNKNKGDYNIDLSLVSEEDEEKILRYLKQY